MNKIFICLPSTPAAAAPLALATVSLSDDEPDDEPQPATRQAAINTETASTTNGRRRRLAVLLSRTEKTARTLDMDFTISPPSSNPLLRSTDPSIHPAGRLTGRPLAGSIAGTRGLQNVL